MPRKNRNAGGSHHRGNSGKKRVHRGRGGGKRRRHTATREPVINTGGFAVIPESRYAAKQKERVSHDPDWS